MPTRWGREKEDNTHSKDSRVNLDKTKGNEKSKMSIVKKDTGTYNTPV
jgi:hypothetical protein